MNRKNRHGVKVQEIYMMVVSMNIYFLITFPGSKHIKKKFSGEIVLNYLKDELFQVSREEVILI